jgi:hypothetical protein
MFVFLFISCLFVYMSFTPMTRERLNNKMRASVGFPWLCDFFTKEILAFKSFLRR